MATETIEQQVARTLLQKPTAITVGNEQYTMAPPSIATLVLASEAISELPAVNTDPGNPIAGALAIAEECRPIGDTLAILILGAKGLTQKRENVRKYLWGLLKRKSTEVVDRKAELARKILEEMTPQQAFSLLNTLLSNTQIAFFLSITTSLTEVNMLKKTKNPTTASGQ